MLASSSLACSTSPASSEPRAASSISAMPGERLHRPVVELQREPAPLLLLGGDQLVGEQRGFGLAHVA